MSFSYIFLTFASWLGVAHSKKKATLTVLASAEIVKEINIEIMINFFKKKLNIFFTLILLIK
jgi:hypothetical protein